MIPVPPLPVLQVTTCPTLTDPTTVERFSNGTCSPITLSQERLRAYLEFGTTEGTFFVDELAANQEKIDVANTWYSESGKTSQLEKLTGKRVTILQKALTAALKEANRQEHPAIRALAIAQVKELSRQIENLSHPHWHSFEDALKDLSVEEARECSHAAKRADSPEHQLLWVRRGLKTMDFPTDPAKTFTCAFEYNKQKCDIAHSLFLTAGQAFLDLPVGSRHHSNIIDSPHNDHPLDARSPFTESEWAAARCFRNAALCVRRGAHDDYYQMLQKAIDILKGIDTTDFPLEVKADLQEEIATLSYAKCTHSQYAEPNSRSLTLRFGAVAFAEVMEEVSLYDQLIENTPTENTYEKTHYRLKKALTLQGASRVMPDIQKRAALLRQAQNIIEREALYPYDCRFSNVVADFDHWLRSSRENTLNAEHFALEEMMTPPQSVAGRLLNGIKGWLKA